MAADRILLANQKSVATRSKTEGGNEVHFQRIITEPVLWSDAVEKFLADSGSVTMAVDGSVTAVNFDYTNSSDWVLHELVWYMADGSLADFDKFGPATLSNGIRLVLRDDSPAEVLDLFDGQPVKSLGQLAGQFGRVVVESGTPDDMAVCRAFFDEGRGLIIPADYTLRVIIQDDLSALTRMTAKVRGEVRG